MSLAILLACACDARAEEGQLAALVSPGPLSRPHATLEGIRQCQSCHEAGRGVSAAKCLGCHKPVAQRIAAGKGIHRRVKDDCVTCHVEHMGLDAELRPFDTSAFDHARDTGYALDGEHAPLADKCAACHKTRSFLTVTVACASCHEDVHKGSLGASCERCHSTSVAFKTSSAEFNHTATKFPLTGAHRSTTCASCHVNRVYTGLKFAECSDCHKDPHAQRLEGTCSSCHATDTWRTVRINHDLTRYPLEGKHEAVACARCHVGPALRVKPRSDTCAACHSDPHRGEFKQDCKACHVESGFAKTSFDHKTTSFPLGGKHASARCDSCHKEDQRKGTAAGGASKVEAVVRFSGLKSECVACHTDAHQNELGAACQNCHGDTTFAIAAYTHQRPSEFFKGGHAPVKCEGCHLPVSAKPSLPAAARVSSIRYTAATTRCVTCHEDVHLGQVDQRCELCHAVDTAKFALSGFDHRRTSFPLTGKHEQIECRSCHKPETGRFPSVHGTAVRLTGLSRTCTPCHADIHLGQVGAQCETCHDTVTFRLAKYTHRNRALAGFFIGRHATARCDQCHTEVVGRFPAGEGQAIRYAIDPRCTTCHLDVHDGQLGSQCGDCHRLEGGAR
jgi:hypothetical protein